MSVSAEMRTGAQQLAALIEAGEYRALAPFQRTELRRLACAIDGWADRVDSEHQPAPLRHPSLRDGLRASTLVLATILLTLGTLPAWVELLRRLGLG